MLPVLVASVAVNAFLLGALAGYWYAMRRVAALFRAQAREALLRAKTAVGGLDGGPAAGVEGVRGSAGFTSDASRRRGIAFSSPPGAGPAGDQEP